ncbi:hypothetical protein GKE82_23310 [Conexibacter sp. W3-3-2]|uniref:helicase-related protein n=1 Tax=Conexibacter sp. W3-3-2 TaxID=2675227 RepID=UPI0012B95E80|nr:helicase-related protein [Conexibacter sp. W3-3-2]MTD47133.1 hypothetical protein [Conexibacter sp. W3-3-2]
MTLASRCTHGHVSFHAGPPNSGKTHHALTRLLEVGGGVYAAPLRMLAEEAYRRLSQVAGAHRVGLLTGEQRINADAPLLACTAELAPDQGTVLVIDEAHHAADPDRGSAYTRLLLATTYTEAHLIGGTELLPIIRSLIPHAQIHTYERMGRLELVGYRTLEQLPDRTILVTFSRATVLQLAAELQQLRPGRVSALYGALPIGARRDQIARFELGRADVLVATSVIAHGVNLTAQEICFAQTSRYDGRRTRPLEPWEAAQIAGRAGRGAQTGRISVLHQHPDFRPHLRVAHSALQATVLVDPATGTYGYRRIERLQAAMPRPADLAQISLAQLQARLERWQRPRRAPPRDCRVVHGGSPSQLSALQVLARAGHAQLPGPIAWALSHAPLDPQAPDGRAQLLELAELAADPAADAPDFGSDRARQRNMRRRDLDLAGLEEIARLDQLSAWARTVLGGPPLAHEDLAPLVVARLRHEINARAASAHPPARGEPRVRPKVNRASGWR